ILYLPELPFFRSARERAESAAMAAAGEQYQEGGKDLEREKSGGPTRDELLRRGARNMRDLGRAQQRGRLAKKEALLRANELQKALKDAERRIGGAQSRSMEQAAEQVRHAAERQAQAGGRDTAEALQRLSESLSNGDTDAAHRELDRLAQQLQRSGAEG